MACCVMAAFLFAQCVYVLRRWGRFWGLLPRGDDLELVTALDMARAWLRKPLVRASVCVLVTVELSAFGTWVWVDHHDHLLALAQALATPFEARNSLNSEMCVSDIRAFSRLTRTGN